MTREQAIKTFIEKRPAYTTDSAAWVDLCVALGMLKLEEPKSAVSMALEIIESEVKEWNMILNGSIKASDVSSSLLRQFGANGLKVIIEK